jgi:hypothetical protein
LVSVSDKASRAKQGIQAAFASKVAVFESKGAREYAAVNEWGFFTNDGE